METIVALAELLLFPGLLFLLAASLLLAWVDRKTLALLQGRVGPPLYQPLADLLKLLGKEDINTAGSDVRAATLLPALALACSLTAGLMVPVGHHAVIAFEGDLVVALFLLSVPTLGLFLAGWIVPSVYNVLGGNRSLLQYFAYEVPLLLGLAAPAVYSRAWRIAGLMAVQSGYHWHVFAMPAGFLVANIGLIGKLERVPLDTPHAKTEIGAGPLTEYSGRKLALWRLTAWVQTLVGVNLMVAVYAGGVDQLWPYRGFWVYVLKVLAYMSGLALVQALYARLRIDQVLEISWHLAVPLGLLQLLLTFWMGG